MRTLSRACLVAIAAAVSIPTPAHATPSSTPSSSAPISSTSVAPSSSSSAAPSTSTSAATTTTTAATTTTTKAPPPRTTTTATTVRPVVTFPTCPGIPPEAPPIAHCPTTTTAATVVDETTTTAQTETETQIVESDTPVVVVPPAPAPATTVPELPRTGPSALGWFVVIAGWFLVNGVVVVVSIRRNWRGAIMSSLVGTTSGLLIGLALTDSAPVMLGVFAALVDIAWLASRIGQVLRRHDAALERGGDL